MFRQLVNVVSRSTSAAKLPSDGLRLNASKPESMLLRQCILLLVTWFDLEPFQRTRLRPMPIQQVPPLMGVCVLFQQNLCVTSDPLRKRFRQIRVSYVLREAIVLRSIDVYPLVLDLVRPHIPLFVCLFAACLCAVCCSAWWECQLPPRVSPSSPRLPVCLSCRAPRRRLGSHWGWSAWVLFFVVCCRPTRTTTTTTTSPCRPLALVCLWLFVGASLASSVFSFFRSFTSWVPDLVRTSLSALFLQPNVARDIL